MRLLSLHGRAVTRWSSVPVAPQWLRNGHVADARALAAVIREAIDTGGFHASRTVCAFPGLRSANRLLSLPPIAPRQLEAVVNREARRLMAFSAESSYLFWRPLPRASAQLQVFVLTVPREPLVTLVEAMRLAGVKPRAIDIKPLALGRAVNRDRAIVASGELNSVEVVILSDGLPQVMRGVFLGDEGVTPDLAAARLVEELSRTLSFYNDTHREQPLGREVPVYVAGDMATPDLAGLVQDTTGHQVLQLQPPLRYPADLPLATFAVNVGLALKML